MKTKEFWVNLKQDCEYMDNKILGCGAKSSDDLLKFVSNSDDLTLISCETRTDLIVLYSVRYKNIERSYFVDDTGNIDSIDLTCLYHPDDYIDCLLPDPTYMDRMIEKLGGYCG